MRSRRSSQFGALPGIVLLAALALIALPGAGQASVITAFGGASGLTSSDSGRLHRRVGGRWPGGGRERSSMV